jgi:diguanylate cyclase (GGDEF)-like protein
MPPSPAARTLDLHALDAPALARFVERHKASAAIPAEVDFGLQLKQILEKACELVPSESGCILLDDPLSKVADRGENELCFVAAFGPASGGLPGRRIAARTGVVGLVYRTGLPHLAGDAPADAAFSAEVDRDTGHHTRSLVAVPVTIGETVIGVIELVNRLDGGPYAPQDLLLLEIFARYTSFALQNALDARRAAELARRDDLTGLCNDRHLHERLVELVAEADASGRECAVIFLDLDGFKGVNDAHGHLAGSQVLREMGFILPRVVAREDAVLSRYGGDEFVVGLPATSLADALEVAEAVRAAIAGHVFIDRGFGPSLPALHLRGAISSSIGVASHVPAPPPRSSASASESAVLRRADAAMYAAKARGKNCVVSADDLA